MAKRKEVTGEIARHAARWEDGRVYVTITDDDGHSKMIGMIMPAVRVQGFKAMLDVEVSPRHRTLLRVGTVCKTRCAAERALRRAYKEG